MNLSLENKTALIAGSTQGIGFASAVELAKLGAKCILIARNEEKLKEAIKMLPAAHHQQHQYLVADFSNYKEVEKVVQDFTVSNVVHILINNSGGPAGGSIVNATEQAFIDTFEQHLICNHLITKAVIEGMKSEGYGRIVNVISTSVKIPLKGLGVSNTIRGAVASWAKTMANELGQFGITVNNVLPGATATGRLSSIMENNAQKTGLSKEAIEESMVAEIPLKRIGQPEEIAAVIAFLTTPAAAYVNGTSIPVDGGRTGSI